MAERTESLKYLIQAIWGGKGATTEAKSDIKGVGESAKKSEEGGLKSFNQGLQSLQASFVTVAAAGAVFKTTFELGKQGASLNQLSESFNLMNERVFKTPDLLNQMQTAVRGTIKETDLMKGLLTLTAGTTQEMGRRFAEAAPQLLEIAKASNKLNPALGDTAFLYDSIALGIKRGSPMILDNLGLTIKVGDANQKMADQLGKTVDQLTAEEKTMAILNATLAAGDLLIEQVGGTVDSQQDSWLRLETQVGQLADKFKQWLADGLTPWLDLMTGGYTQAMDNAINKSVQFNQSNPQEGFEKINAAMQEILNNPVGGLYDEQLDQLKQSALELVATVGDTSSVDRFKDSLAGMGDFTVSTSSGFIWLNGTMIGTVDQVRGLQAETARLASIQANASADIKFYNAAAEQTADVTEEVALTTEELAKQQEAARLAAFRQHEGLIALRDGEQFAKEEQIARAEATAREAETDNLATEAKARAAAGAAALAEKQKAAAIASGDLFASFMRGNGELKFFNESLDDLGPQLVTVNGRTATQNSELSRLQGIYSKAAQTIRDYDAGLKGVNLTEEGRAQKIAEQQTLMANAEAAMQPLLSIAGQLQTVNVGLTFNQQALNSAFIDAADAAGANDVQLALLTSTLGGYSEEAANALLQQTLMQVKINQLAADYVAGKISIAGVKEELRLFGLQVAGTASAMLDSASKADAMKSSLDPLTNGLNDTALAAETAGNKLRDIPTDVVVKISYNADPFPSIPSNPDGQKGGAGGGNAGALMVLPGSGVAPLPPSSRRGSNGNGGGLNWGGVVLQIFVNGADMGKNPKGAARMLASNVISELQAMVG